MSQLRSKSAGNEKMRLGTRPVREGGWYELVNSEPVPGPAGSADRHRA